MGIISLSRIGRFQHSILFRSQVYKSLRHAVFYAKRVSAALIARNRCFFHRMGGDCTELTRLGTTVAPGAALFVDDYKPCLLILRKRINRARVDARRGAALPAPSACIRGSIVYFTWGHFHLLAEESGPQDRTTNSKNYHGFSPLSTCRSLPYCTRHLQRFRYEKLQAFSTSPSTDSRKRRELLLIVLAPLLPQH